MSHMPWARSQGLKDHGMDKKQSKNERAAAIQMETLENYLGQKLQPTLGRPSLASSQSCQGSFGKLQIWNGSDFSSPGQVPDAM